MKTYNGLYLMGNYPDSETFIKAAVKGLEYFDFLEVGVPFSDAVADGPVIVDAANTMLEKGETIHSICESVDKIRKQVSDDKKIYFMTYANIVHALGTDAFCLLCKTHGVSGMILPDIPSLEAAPYRSEASKHGLEFIEFITPESSEKQVKETAHTANGFVYAISVRGITGGTTTVSSEISDKIALAKKETKHPVVMGFGINNVETARNALKTADGVIIGTEAIRRLNESFESFAELIDELKMM